MNDKTKQLIMKNREFLKGYHFGDAGTEKTDQEQELPEKETSKFRNPSPCRI